MIQSHSIWIADRPIAVATGQHLYEAVVSHPFIIDSARRLAVRGSPISEIPPDSSSLYVFQKEFAASPRNCPCILGSDRATTCHILIVLSPLRVFCAHLDGSHEQSTALMTALRATFAEEHELDVHLAGGFSDDRGLSVSLGRDLLTALDRGWTGVRFNLKTACIGPVNTASTPQPAPVIRALAFDLQANELIANAWFSNRGPNVDWRSARAMFGTAPLVRATDPATGKTTFDAADSLAIPDRRNLEEMLQFDDRTLLQMTSTSPTVEHDMYCREMRATLRCVLGLLQEKSER